MSEIEYQEHQRSWRSYARSYDEILPVLPFYKEVVERHVAAMTAPEVHRVLDVGAGTGNVAIPVLRTGRHVTAIDLRPDMLDRLRAKIPRELDSQIDVIELNAQDPLPFAKESFDGVNVLLAFYDMLQPRVAFRNARDALRRGGVLAVTEPKACFQLNPLLDFVNAFLDKEGLVEELADDWARVIYANRVLDPSRRKERMFAEEIVEILNFDGFSVREVRDSHLGNCATITATK